MHMDCLRDYQTLWFALIGFLLVVYSLLDGFDLGIGALLAVIGKTRQEKDLLIHSIAPVWDGNEVWLITAGGALFAAFPQAYATAFSGFYLAIMLILLALIFRAVSMEFRGEDEAHALAWEKAFTGSSVSAVLLLGVALGNVVYGIPLDENMAFTGNILTMFRPVPIWFGITGLIAVLLQGVTYAIMKTEGALQERCFQTARVLGLIYLITVITYFAILIFTFDDAPTNWLFYVAICWTIFWLIELFFSLHKKYESAPFWESSFVFIGLWMAVAAIHFPHLIKASNNPKFSLTVYNSSTGLSTLKIMTVMALVGMPVVIAYTIFVYRIFRGKTTPADPY